MTKEELLARVEVLTAQIARLRAEMEDLGAHFEAMSRSDQGDAVTWSCAATTIRESLAEIEAETPTESLEAMRAKEYAMREALQFVIDCGHEDVDWCGASTKESAIEVCRRALEATPEQCASRLEAVRAEARLQTLKDIASLVPGIDEGPLDKGSILTRLSGWLDEAGKADLDVIRAEAGRERAVRELAELANKCRHVAHLPNMGHEAVIPTRFLRERLEEIAKEGK